MEDLCDATSLLRDAMRNRGVVAEAFSKLHQDCELGGRRWREMMGMGGMEGRGWMGRAGVRGGR